MSTATGVEPGRAEGGLLAGAAVGYGWGALDLGVEIGLDALLSPTHLVLLTEGFLSLTDPPLLGVLTLPHRQGPEWPSMSRWAAARTG